MLGTASDLAKRDWVVFLLDGQKYAICTDHVRELAVVGPTSAVPHAPDYVRGVSNMRGMIVPVYDLRMWLGMASARDDIAGQIQMLTKLEQDHRNWVSGLEIAVREDRPFSGTTDPHRCAFGVWYDQYHPEDVYIRSFIRKFDAPHKAIHGVAANVLEASARGDRDGAQALIESVRDTELARMVELFDRFRDRLREDSREEIIVMEIQGRALGVVVDSIRSVERLGETFDSTENLPDAQHEPRVPLIGRSRADGGVVLLPDVELLLAG